MSMMYFRVVNGSFEVKPVTADQGY